MTDFVFEFPVDVFREKVLGFLSFQDIVKLDSAIANRALRIHLYQILVSTVLAGMEDIYCNFHVLKWLKQRGLRVANAILVPNITDEAVRLTTESVLRDAKKIIVGRNSRATDKYLEYIAQNCNKSTLEELDLGGSSSESSAGIIALIKQCTKLQAFSSGRRHATNAVIDNLALHCRQLLVLRVGNIVRDESLISIAHNCTGLTVLHLLCGKTISDISIITISTHCTGLKDVNLTMCSLLTDASIQVMATHCTGLREISLSQCPNITNAAIIVLSQFRRGLLSFALESSSSITDEAINSLSTHCTGLRTLELKHCNHISDASIVLLAQRCTNLQSVSLQTRYLITVISDDAVISLAKHCQQLRQLECYICTLTDAAILALAKYATSLQSLHIEYCYAVTNDALVQLFLRCSNLLHFHAPYHANDATLIAISEHCANIRTFKLDLFVSTVTDYGIAAMAEHCPQLETLFISCEFMTDWGIFTIANGCKRLRTAVLFYCINITNNAMISLFSKCTRLNNIQITHAPLLTDAIYPAINQLKHFRTCMQVDCPNISSDPPNNFDNFL